VEHDPTTLIGGVRGAKPPAPTIRTFVVRPSGPLGRLALAAVLIGAGALLLTLGLAIIVSLAAVAAISGAGVLAYRGVTGRRGVDSLPTTLDPRGEIRGGTATLLPPSRDED
jgi:membrane protein implicated in regulation of membrane protease activity